MVKDYEGKDKEVEQAVQLGLQGVISEDPRYLEQAAPPMAEEFPDGSRIIFLGEHAYGVAAQVAGTKEDTLTIVIAVRSNESWKALHWLIRLHVVLPGREHGERQFHGYCPRRASHTLLSIIRRGQRHRHQWLGAIKNHLKLHGIG